MSNLLLELVKEQLTREKNAEEEKKRFNKQFSFLDFNPLFLTLWLSGTTIQRENRTRTLQEIVERMEKGYVNQTEQQRALPSS